MPFWIYYTICILTHPFRWLMFWWPQRNFQFAVKLLFWNRSKYTFIVAQSYQESGVKHNTIKAFQHFNYFGMGYTKNSPYQKGSNSIGSGGVEPKFASYSNPYKGVYDIYHYYYTRMKQAGQKLNETPTNYDVQSFNLYSAGVVGTLKALKYFSGNMSTYHANIKSFANSVRDVSFNFWTCVVLTLFIPSIVFYLCCGRNYSIKRIFY